MSLLFSQTWHNHPELDWFSFETENFVYHYHKETQRTAMEAALVAEKVYKPITRLYNYEPSSKTHIILKDVNDFSNGMAYYYSNKIEIWAMPLDYDLRGSHRWLQNVITHEFIHIIQLGASMKFGNRVPNMFFQMMGYEDEKREDVLYGFPNKIISYPLPGTSVPPWLAEGTAQYMFEGADYDYWDSHRDMIVRDRALNDNLLSFIDMNTFGKKGIGHESVYNQGFKLVEYIVKKYGQQSLEKISSSLAKPYNYSIKKAIFDATGNSSEDIYNEWVDDLKSNYEENINHIYDSSFETIILESDGTTNINPLWSPSGDKFTFLSSKENDYFSQTDLYMYDFLDSSSVKLIPGVKSTSTWINDTTIVYSKHSKPDIYGSIFFDLYKYDINCEEETRLTYYSRLMHPIYNDSINKIAAIKTYDGTSNIWISDFTEDDLFFEEITTFNDGTYIPSITFLNNKIIFTAINNQTRDIYSIDLNDNSISVEVNTAWDTRSPATNGDRVVYTSDENGIFNLCLSDISDFGCSYITNVLGGAFMPTISNNGKILYSLYSKGKYQIALIDTVEILNEDIGYKKYDQYNMPVSELITAGAFDLETTNPSYLFYNQIDKSSFYSEKMTPLSIIPKLMIDYETIKPGFYFFTDDYLDKLSIFGGASTNKSFDLDLFLMFEYKKFLPTFYTNLFWVTRHNSIFSNYIRSNGSVVDNIDIESDLTFLIFSGVLGTRFQYNKDKFWLEYNYNNYREHVKQKIIQYGPYENVEIEGEVAFDYYRGHIFSFIMERSRVKSTFLKSMLPKAGYKIKTKMFYEFNQFMDGFAVDEDHGTFGANFMPNNTMRIEIDADYHYTLLKSYDLVGSASLNIGWISNPDIDDFFYFFGGGLPGLKGFTFYDERLTGSTKAIFSNSIRIPIVKEANYSIGHLVFQNFSVGFISQIGKSFLNGNLVTIDDYSFNYLYSNGIEFRVSGFSFFAYPTAINYEYHLPSDFKFRCLEEDDNTNSCNGGKHYLNILFDFDLGL